MNDRIPAMAWLKSRASICLLLTITICAVYWQTKSFDYVNFDDPFYVYANNTVRQGITFEGIKWAFTTFHVSNWHPLTWISHMLDIQFFGVNPGMHHLINVLFHILNTILLFLVLEKMTGSRGKAAGVAALFALHPVHVESVAWVSERKDVLSAFFWMLTTAVYLWYIKQRGIARYLLVVFFFILGLLTKPMVVTLPFVLLLIDFWPLKRLPIPLIWLGSSGQQAVGPGSTPPGGKAGSRDPEIVFTAQEGTGSSGLHPGMGAVIAEKVPLIILSFLSCCVTFYAQQKGGAIVTQEALSLGLRVPNVIVSYALYLVKTIWPFNLAVYYPFKIIALYEPKFLLSLFVVLSITFITLAAFKRFPYLITGWFWYLGTLVPVIGIVQVGGQSMADRYTYIPLIGIFIMAVWGLSDVFKTKPSGKNALGVISVAVFIFFTYMTWLQVSTWKDGETLFRHALTVTKNNYLAHERLGTILFDRKEIDSAIREYQEALQIYPTQESYSGLGRTYVEKNDIGKAIYYYSKGLEINPKSLTLQFRMGFILARTGDTEGAIRHFNKALSIDPENIEVCYNLGKAYLQAGRPHEAIPYFQKVLQIDPGQKTAQKYLNNATEVEKRYSAIAAKIQDELKSRPRDAMLYIKLGDIHSKVGRHDEAIVNYRKAISLQPGCIQAMYGIALVHTSRGEYDNAMEMLQDIRKIQPENPNPYYNIACLYAKQGKKDESVSWLRQAIEKGFKDVNLIGKDPDLANIRDTQYVRELMEGNKGQ